ncbi:MAG: hypothetical protein A3I75_02000 [Deltaproteobacteria bacterium RIFCSPLOWO2_02_FULL_50_16]|nr:MAG: hypothetical protein A2053_03850 [Deltaproteobacteria bacterium GWA2_50_8]OGQ25708.1 MAG: hypothetical protein A3B79_07165 [Deltaproteobacteria bacterium RIFCSPHIGHO2_02_FULL_50_15]OGQ56971.1 MAG: hypothetical protein A3I75_02000 [Deltaproteobacteria bacterium RIFCSPLOWO2_02_FULL_50_16]
MLDLMRKKAASWVIKVLLGAIILTFMFFFGYSQLSSPSMGNEPLAARVGDEGITQKSYYAAINQSLEQIKGGMKDTEINESILSMIQGNVLNQLINQKVRAHFASMMGFDIPPEILATEIKKNPNLNKNGYFDIEFYRKSFRPYFQREYGVDFEKILKDEILLDQFQNTINNGLFMSPVESQWLNEHPKKTINLEKVEIPPKSLAKFIEITPDEVHSYLQKHEDELKQVEGVSPEILATQKIQDIKSQDFAEKFANDIQKKWMDKKLSKEYLKKYNLTQESLENIDMTTSNRIFFKDIPDDLAAKVFSLSSQAPFLDKPVFMNGNYYVLKFAEHKSDENLNDIDQNTQNPHYPDFFSRWLNGHRKHVQIESYIKN